MGFLKNNNTNKTFDHLDGINRLLVSEINNNQKIKRLCTYLSYQPLEPVSTLYDGKRIYQRDIKGSLLNYQNICINESGTPKSEKDIIKINPILYPYPFQEEQFVNNYITMYCYYGDTNLYDRIPCEHIYYLNILIPIECMTLKPYGENRGNLILSELTNLIDGAELDDKSKEKYGDLHFKFYGQVSSHRITKSNNILIWTIPIRVSGFHTLSDANNKFVRINQW